MERQTAYMSKNEAALSAITAMLENGRSAASRVGGGGGGGAGIVGSADAGFSVAHAGLRLHPPPDILVLGGEHGGSGGGGGGDGGGGGGGVGSHSLEESGSDRMGVGRQEMWESEDSARWVGSDGVQQLQQLQQLIPALSAADTNKPNVRPHTDDDGFKGKLVFFCECL